MLGFLILLSLLAVQPSGERDVVQMGIIDNNGYCDILTNKCWLPIALDDTQGFAPGDTVTVVGWDAAPCRQCPGVSQCTSVELRQWQPHDYGCGVLYIDRFKGCHFVRYEGWSIGVNQTFGASDGDTVRVMAWPPDSCMGTLCSLGQVEVISLESCAGDTLSPVETLTWGQIKARFDPNEP